MAVENRPNSLWPVGSKIEFLNAWGRDPVDGSIIRHYGDTNVLVEDARGVRHFGATWRISTAPKPVTVDLDDLLDLPSPIDLDDLLV